MSSRLSASAASDGDDDLSSADDSEAANKTLAFSDLPHLERDRICLVAKKPNADLDTAGLALLNDENEDA
eukprot:CAMPEP_0178572188 /NCGR_PEP_ID=MMETSP0697-20121206/18079_1 /TAXON_ID=265572 /ORGANISM="Extubocellulus spinifer, Strain CCMP396" /LENGTH=69 /DNA_ID=CAMNT_0020206879 /DNA_START=480 /DNA_END=690 /DNA_ORIENTATION=-